MGGKIINTALLIPAGALYTTTGAPVLKGEPNLPLKRGRGGPNLMRALIFYDIGP